MFWRGDFLLDLLEVFRAVLMDCGALLIDSGLASRIFSCGGCFAGGGGRRYGLLRWVDAGMA